MLSLKRLIYIILAVAVLGGILLVYGIVENRSSGGSQEAPFSERAFTETRQVDEGQKPRIWVLGDPQSERYGAVFRNVCQYCADLHLAVIADGRLNIAEVEARDLVVFCDGTVSRYVDLNELEDFVAEGGHVIFGAGVDGEMEEDALWTTLGIQNWDVPKDCHDLVFKKPLLPVQPKQAFYDGASSSAQIEVIDDASVYIEDAKSEVPLLYARDWQKGKVCMINGTFLADMHCMGLLAGAIGTLLPDFVYPVLGVKAVFLDNFPVVSSANDELSRQAYGYSVTGFVEDVAWPVFQGISLRTETPYTASVPVMSSSGDDFGMIDDDLLMSIGSSIRQFDGELVYGAACSDETVVFNQAAIDEFSNAFPNYTVRGLVLEEGGFSPNMLKVSGADIRVVRSTLDDGDTRLSWENGLAMFPELTRGSGMEQGNLFAIYSLLGAYGMVSHGFDFSLLSAWDGKTAIWDLDKKQIGIFESDVLARATWLEGRTLAQTEGDVRSYQTMEYGWMANGDSLELECSGIVKGQAFFYHTDARIIDAQGLSYESVGNGYYLLRVQDNHASITLQEGE